MLATLPAASNAAATLLAIVVSANGRIDAREVAELDRLRAWPRLDIARDSFLALVTAGERLVHAALLSHWHVSDTMVAHAIMRDRGG